MRVGLLLLCALSGCSHLVWYGHSDDRRHVAAVREVGNHQWVRYDYRDGPEFSGVGVDALQLHSAHVAYPARLDDGKWVVVHDGKPSAPFDGIGEVVLSDADVLFAAQVDAKWFVVSDSMRSGPWDEVVPGSLHFAPSPVFFARRGGKAFAVVEGKESGPFDSVGGFAASGDGRAFAFITHAADGFRFQTNTGEIRGPWEGLADLVVADDFIGFSARREGKWRANDEGPAFDKLSRLVLTPGVGRGFVVAGRRDGAEWVVVGETQFGPFRALKRQLGVSGAGVVFAGKRADGWYVVRGASESGPWEDVHHLDTHGGHDAFLGERDGRTWLVRDGLEIQSWEFADALVLSRDGAHVLYVARSGAQTLLVSDDVTTPFDLVLADTLTFTPDGKHFGAVTGERTTKRLFITFDDGKRVPVDLEELAAAISRLQPSELFTSPDRALLGRWVEAELAIRFATPH